MTFEAYEQSVDQGRPVELHEFLYGSEYYRYTSGSENYTDADLNVWYAEPIIREAISESQTEGKADITLTMSMTVSVLNPFRSGQPPMGYKLYQLHLDDPDQEKVLAFAGNVIDVVFRPEQLEAQVKVSSLLSVLDDPGLRRKLQLKCPHILYSSDCGVNRNDHKSSATVSSISGAEVTLTGETGATLTNDYFKEGVFEYTRTDLAVTSKNMINSYDPGTHVMVLDTAPDGLGVGETVFLYPGCQHTTTICAERFDNIENYGGCPFTPLKNPFGSDPMF